MLGILAFMLVIAMILFPELITYSSNVFFSIVANNLAGYGESENLRNLALNITRGCVSDFCRMNKIMDYVYETIKYQPDWGLDYYQSPEETLKKGTGDCDDKAILYCSLARQVGLLCKVFSEKNHALTKVCFDDRCYIVDPTNSKIKGA